MSYATILWISAALIVLEALIATVLASWKSSPGNVWINAQGEHLPDFISLIDSRTKAVYRYIALPSVALLMRAHTYTERFSSSSVRAAVRFSIAAIVVDLVVLLLASTIYIFTVYPGVSLWLLVIAAPLILGIFLWLFDPRSISETVNALSNRIAEYCTKAEIGNGTFKRYAIRPIAWAYGTTHHLTEQINDEALRGGVRLSTWLYLAGLIIAAAILAISIVIGLVLLVAGLAIIGLLLSLMGDSKDTSEDTEARVKPRSAGATASRKRKDMFGNDYVEHRDANGNVVGKSRDRKDMFGSDYVEHRDADGNVVGQSRDRKDMFGSDYVERRDADDDVVGKSRDRKDIFGSGYVEHRDADGNVVGKSRDRKDMFGSDYVEHRDADGNVVGKSRE